MKTALFYFLTMFFALWIQMAGNYFLGAWGLSANVILIIVLYFGLVRGPMTGILMGFFWGLLVDASSLGLIGLHAFLYACAGFIAGLLRRQLDEKKMWTQAIFTLGVSVLYTMFYFILDRVFSTGPHPVSWSMAAQPLLNAAVAPLFFWMMQGWAQLWDIAPVEQ